jgi:uncharacterized small protein (DUF1192 family)
MTGGARYNDARPGEARKDPSMKNGKPNELEERLARLEADVKEIKALLQNKTESTKPWWEETIGMFKDPVGQEIVRLGLEVREKDRRKTRRARAKVKK